MLSSVRMVGQTSRTSSVLWTRTLMVHKHHINKASTKNQICFFIYSECHYEVIFPITITCHSYFSIWPFVMGMHPNLHTCISSICQQQPCGKLEVDFWADFFWPNRWETAWETFLSNCELCSLSYEYLLVHSFSSQLQKKKETLVHDHCCVLCVNCKHFPKLSSKSFWFALLHFYNDD